MPYIGKDPGTGLRGRFIYTATAGQTSFTGADSLGRTLTYTDSEYTDVYLNGVKLDKTDYTATSGTSIVLDSGASAGDILEILAFDTFGLFSGEFAQDVTVAGALTVSGTTTTAATTMTGDLSLADKIVHTGDTNTAIRFPAADTVTIETAASERVRVDDSGSVGIGTASPSNATLDVAGRGRFLQDAAATTGAIILRESSGGVGGHVQFVTNDNSGQRGFIASNSSSDILFGSSAERMRMLSAGGLTFNGDTAAANALDDYEEGTWTPTLSASGASSFAYGVQVGLYVKVGQLCHFSGRITLTSNGNADSVSNQLFIASLPFTAASSGNDFVSISIGFHNSWDLGIRAGLVFPGTTTVGLYAAASTSSLSVISAGVAASQTTSTSDLIFSGTYRTT